MAIYRPGLTNWKNPGIVPPPKVPTLIKAPFVNTNNRASASRPVVGLNAYKWNLPPHKWSLPVEPSSDPMVKDAATKAIGASHKYRRGRIYWYARVDSDYAGLSSTAQKEYNNGKGTHKTDPRYGFQFMWNPTQISTSVATNMSVTPTFADKFASVVGAFPSGQALTVSIPLDRTNDFACLNSLNIGENYLRNTTLTKANVGRLLSNLGYNPNHSFDFGFAETLVEKVIALIKYGTTADIEYLYKAINGPGWTNVATGRDTSEIGFLRPTLLRIDLGPLSYLGYVSALNVSHTKFTKGMIPMASTLDIQFNLMATAGLVSK